VGQRVQARRVEVAAARGIADEGVVGPAVPKPGHHVVELARRRIALVVRHVVLAAEVERGVGIGGDDDVPAGAAIAQVIERGEAARDVEGLVEGGRGGRDEADALGGLAQRRQQREGFERAHGVAALERLHRHVEHGEMVGHEEGVEARALQRLREAPEVGEVEVGVGEGARVAPGTGVDADGAHEGAELELAVRRHGFTCTRRPSKASKTDFLKAYALRVRARSAPPAPTESASTNSHLFVCRPAGRAQNAPAFTPSSFDRPTMSFRNPEFLAPRVLSVLRVVSAFLLIQHGSAKLLGFPRVAFFDNLQIFSLLGVAGILELVGGVLLLIGLFTRPTAFVLSGLLAFAYFLGHATKGFVLVPFLNQGEAAVLFSFVFLYIAAAGAGPWSVDALRASGRANAPTPAAA
jgi:putative oxidoreductase